MGKGWHNGIGLGVDFLGLLLTLSTQGLISHIYLLFMPMRGTAKTGHIRSYL